ncbi:hypothetical protein BDZ97DRAFT_601916 [Flammula alnicola]|nr:hypothetical protein BDZ97DRAFT_601916 [Flammula alnicola]
MLLNIVTHRTSHRALLVLFSNTRALAVPPRPSQEPSKDLFLLRTGQESSSSINFHLPRIYRAVICHSLS